MVKMSPVNDVRKICITKSITCCQFRMGSEDDEQIWGSFYIPAGENWSELSEL